MTWHFLILGGQKAGSEERNQATFCMVVKRRRIQSADDVSFFFLFNSTAFRKSSSQSNDIIHTCHKESDATNLL